VEGLLARLGNPERDLPPVVHVAGTNGKGSTIAFMRAMLEAAGYRVHVFTSPHLIRFNERVRLAGDLIGDAALSELLIECETVNMGQPITFFEITTAAAFLAFSRTPADVVLLETGLGGRLDATNVLERPALTVLTPVSIDHKDFLGDTITDIAGEKAGILKAGVKCISAGQLKMPAKVIADRAKELNVPVLREGADWFMAKLGNDLEFRAGERRLKLPLPALAGGHQVHNAGLAVACVENLPGFKVPDGAMALGMRSVDWPARLQPLTRGPLAELLPDGWELWLDGGHNPAAGKAIAAQGGRWRDRPLHLILGMMRNKDPLQFLKPLEARAQRVRTVAIPDHANCASAEDLSDAARAWALDAAPAADVAAALKDIVTAESRPGRVLICGSLYLAGSILEENA
jgi:dihydrofolate synthase / folylpolyglutamate synthase